MTDTPNRPPLWRVMQDAYFQRQCVMIGFSIEFRPFYIVIRGPRGRVWLATGFSKRPFNPYS